MPTDRSDSESWAILPTSDSELQRTQSASSPYLHGLSPTCFRVYCGLAVDPRCGEERVHAGADGGYPGTEVGAYYGVSVEDEVRITTGRAALVVAQDMDVHPGGLGDLPAAQARISSRTYIPARSAPSGRPEAARVRGRPRCPGGIPLSPGATAKVKNEQHLPSRSARSRI